MIKYLSQFRTAFHMEQSSVNVLEIIRRTVSTYTIHTQLISHRTLLAAYAKPLSPNIDFITKQELNGKADSRTGAVRLGRLKLYKTEERKKNIIFNLMLYCGEYAVFTDGH